MLKIHIPRLWNYPKLIIFEIIPAYTSKASLLHDKEF